MPNDFVVIVEFQIHPDKLGQFRGLIAENARLSMEEEGCRQFDILESDDLPNSIVLYEVYDSVAAFDAHLAMPHVQKFIGAAKDLVTRQTIRRMRRRCP